MCIYAAWNVNFGYSAVIKGIADIACIRKDLFKQDNLSETQLVMYDV